MPVLMRADDGGGLQPRCANVLRRLKEPLFHTQWNLLHPLAIFNRRWASVERAASIVLDAFDQWSAQTGKADDHVRNLLKAHKDLLYDATELIEDFEKNLRRSLIPPDDFRKSPFALSKGLRNHIVMQCNKMKHEHAYLGFVESRYQFSKIPGYSVFALTDPDTLGPQKNIHSQREAFSFAIEIRKIISNIYLLAEEVAVDLTAHGTLDEGPSAIETSPELIKILQRINDLPTIVFPSERPAHMPIFSFDGTSLQIDDKGGEIKHAIGNCTISASHIGDGVNTRFRVPIV